MKRIFTTSLLTTLFGSAAFALPFNQDMVGEQLIPGSMMRPKAPNTVPTGVEHRFQGTEQEALRLTNPVSSSVTSVANGKRLFHANCSPCHGRYVEEKYVPGAVSTFLPGPNLQADFYKTKPDGHYFKYINLGGPIMPAYGYKFSMTEHWDIVNYIRYLQNKGTTR
jgi:mono/diheme cytochrome c family protein